MRQLGFAVLALALLLGAAQSAMAATYEIKVRDTEISPAALTIERGDIVVWKWESGSYAFLSGTGPDDENAGAIFQFAINRDAPRFERTFDKPGQIQYFSAQRPETVLTITVHAPSSVNKRTWGYLKRLFENPAARAGGATR